MKTHSRVTITCLLALGVFTMMSLTTPPRSIADDNASHTISVIDAWARVTIPNRPGAGYMAIRNSGELPDRVVSGTSPLVDRVEIHTHLIEEGVVRMRRVDGVDVPAGADVKFEPGGLHLMMFGMKSALKKGDTLPVTLKFEKAGEVDVVFRIGRPKT